MFERRRQEKIARRKARRAGKRHGSAAGSGLLIEELAASKIAELGEADAMAALITEMQVAEVGHGGRARRAVPWKPLVRIDGRWHPTFSGHMIRVAAFFLVVAVGLGVALSHPLGGAGATLAVATVLWNPTAGSTLALLGLFPVTRYGAKGDGATDNTTAFNTAITRASAAGGGDVTVTKTTGAYMIQGGQVLILSNVNVVGVGRPTIKLIGGSSILPGMFRSQGGLGNWSIRGLILDGNKDAVTSVSGTNGAITIGRNNSDIWIVDNEIANTPNAFVSTAAFVPGDTGIFRVRLLNNYMHDNGVGNKNGLYIASWKDSVLVGNRVFNTYDDNLALISLGSDANDFCSNNIVAFNTCDTSYLASNIVITGYGHKCMFNTCANNGWGNNGYQIGAIRIWGSTGGFGNPVTYDITCSYNHISTWMDGVAGSCGIYVEAARAQVTHNRILMPAVTSQANIIGIRVSTQPDPQTPPTPLGEVCIDDNRINGGFRSIEYVPLVTGVLKKVRIRRNSCFGANSHSILLRPVDGDFVEVSENYTEGAAADGINWAGTWTDGLVSDNTARNCTGWGLNISSGTQVTTRLRGNVAINCTAGARNVAVAFVQDELEKTAPSYQPQLPALVAPADPRGISSVATSTANRVNGVRVIVPRTGTLVDLYVFIATASGNVRGMVYSATADPRSLLFDGGSVAAAANWVKLGDPNLAVKAGDELDFAVQPDNATVTMGRLTTGSTNIVSLPTSFWPSGTATPKLGWLNDPGSFAAPATIAQSALSSTSSVFYVMARVV